LVKAHVLPALAGDGDRSVIKGMTTAGNGRNSVMIQHINDGDNQKAEARG
jgi:hypothetical protein